MGETIGVLVPCIDETTIGIVDGDDAPLDVVCSGSVVIEPAIESQSMSKDYTCMTVTTSINVTQSSLCSLGYGGTLDAGGVPTVDTIVVLVSCIDEALVGTVDGDC